MSPQTATSDATAAVPAARSFSTSAATMFDIPSKPCTLAQRPADKILIGTVVGQYHSRYERPCQGKRQSTKRCEEVQVIGKVVVEVPDQVSQVVNIEDILNDGDTKCKGLPWKKSTFVSTVGTNSTNQQNKTTRKSSLIEAKSSTTSTIAVSTGGKSSTFGAKVLPKKRKRPSKRTKKSYRPDVIDLESEEETIDITNDVIEDEDFGKMEV